MASAPSADRHQCRSIPGGAFRFHAQEIELDASAILQGEPATTPVVVNDRAYTIRVRFPEDTRTTLEQIRNTMITSSSTGKAASLGSLATFQDEAGQTEIRRENLQRDIAVTGRFEGVSLGAGMQLVQQAAGELHIPPTIRVEYGGTYAEQQNRSATCWKSSCSRRLVFTVLLFGSDIRRSHRHRRLRIALDLGRISGALDHWQDV
jgi:multidrug efflux pump subunit AcrB